MALLLSVIVPVYNVENYLPTCIDSIVSQTFSDIELILVDDGSKDSSGAICDEYALKDNRIKVIHSKNAGVAEARNVGLNNSSAPYITFIDSDDYVPLNYLETLVNEMDDVDFLVAEHVKCKRNEINSVIIHSIRQRVAICHEDDFQNLFPVIDNGFLGQPYAKIFSRKILNEHNIRFRKIQSEDEIFVFDYLQYAKSIKKIDYKGYYYIQNENSLSQRHTTLTEMNWIYLMEGFYSQLDAKYHIFKNVEYFYLFKTRMFMRFYWFLLKGYYHDTYVEKEDRFARWNTVSQNKLLKNSSVFFIIKKIENRFAMIICLIAKFRLWLIVDPILKLHLNKYN